MFGVQQLSSHPLGGKLLPFVAIRNFAIAFVTRERNCAYVVSIQDIAVILLMAIPAEKGMSVIL